MIPARRSDGALWERRGAGGGIALEAEGAEVAGGGIVGIDAPAPDASSADASLRASWKAVWSIGRTPPVVLCQMEESVSLGSPDPPKNATASWPETAPEPSGGGGGEGGSSAGRC